MPQAGQNPDDATEKVASEAAPRATRGAEDRRAVGGTQAIDRALKLLKLVGSADGPVTLHGLCSATGLNRTTVWRLMVALEKNGFVCRDPLTREYGIGMAFASVCSSPQRLNAPLIRLCLPEMQRLRDRFRESLFLSVPCPQGSVTVCQLDPERNVRLRDYNNRITPLWGTSTGKALLAHYTDEQLEVLLEKTPPSYTEDTITDPVQLRREIADARRLGYALVEGEWSIEENAISSALLVRGVPVAVLGIGGPRMRLTRQMMEEEVAPELLAACRRLEAKLG